MLKNETPVARSSDIITQEAGSEVMIYDLKTHKVSSLNETSTLIWRLCDGKHTVSEIAGKIGKDVDADLVRVALDQFKKESLLENGASEMYFTAKTRREVIKRIGLASMVALPMVASLVAPGSIHAQSAAFSCSNCVPDGTTFSGSFPGLNNSQTCIANLTNCCCSMMAASGDCSCPQGNCTGSITCAGCIVTGAQSSGTFPGLNSSQTCISNLTAGCCSLMASSGTCSCAPNSGDCSGSITCA